MKCTPVIICLSLCLVLCSAAPSADVETVQNNADVKPDGYNFVLETSDGTKRTEEAILKNIGTENEAISVKGSYSYLGPDGVTYTVNFVADENGFQPEGAHIPRE
ncbi:GH15837 [Drosophila grimshawi]|uniref:GH15837 n=2 Tax=Drosophila grimshawi TaxID=7222 RepID=B4IZU0_DROGR|nr:GH15837 [Drosophila grimshawi]